MSENQLLIESIECDARPIPAGQERLVNQAELDSISDFLQQREESTQFDGAEKGSLAPVDLEFGIGQPDRYRRPAPGLVSDRAVKYGAYGNEIEGATSSDMSSAKAGSPFGNGAGINRFLLCTIVGRVAREVKARGEAGGERMRLQRIARDVLEYYQRAGASSWQSLLDEEPLADELKKCLQAIAKQSCIQHGEAPEPTAYSNK